jgi:hypothetical protein
MKKSELISSQPDQLKAERKQFSASDYLLFNHLLCACTSAESHKRNQLSVVCGENLTGVFITSANTIVPEKVFNQLYRPHDIAALKVIQNIPKKNNVQPFILGIIGAEFLRQCPGAHQQVGGVAKSFVDRIESEHIPLTLLATDVVLGIENTNISAGSAHLNQPGDINDIQLTQQLRQQLSHCGKSSLKGGLIKSVFQVGMAGVKFFLPSIENVNGQVGTIAQEFFFSPIPQKVIKQYVKQYGDRARRVNGGVMWEYFQDYIQIIGGVSRNESSFDDELNHLMAMTSGIPEEISQFLLAFSGKNRDSKQKIATTSSRIQTLSQEILGIKTTSILWRTWYQRAARRQSQ